MTLTKEEAVYILNAMKTRDYKPRINGHTGNDLNDMNRAALELAVKAVENMGCGCDLCLVHNNMQCPKLKT